MNQTLNDPRIDHFLNQGTPVQTVNRRAQDPRALTPVTADSFVWLAKLWLGQWFARRSPSATPTIQDQAAERGFNRLSSGL